MTSKLLVELTAGLANRLNAYCQKTGGTRGGVIRVALEAHLRHLDQDENEQFFVELPTHVAETLAAYRDVQDSPDRSKLVERALMFYIEQRCASEPSLKDRIDAARRDLARQRIHALEQPRFESERGR